MTHIRADSSSPLDVILPVQYFHVIVLQSQVRETKPAAGREGKPGAESEIQTGLFQGVFTLYWAILLKKALSSGQVAGCFTEPGHGIQIYLPPQKMTKSLRPTLRRCTLGMLVACGKSAPGVWAALPASNHISLTGEQASVEIETSEAICHSVNSRQSPGWKQP